jgi:hypothetical protein
MDFNWSRSSAWAEKAHNNAPALKALAQSKGLTAANVTEKSPFPSWGAIIPR